MNLLTHEMEMHGTQEQRRLVHRAGVVSVLAFPGPPRRNEGFQFLQVGI